MEQKMLRQYADKKDNVLVMDIICFEYLLLEFKDLISWIWCTGWWVLNKTKKSNNGEKKILSVWLQLLRIDYKDIKEIIDYNEAVDSYNIEQLSAKILFDLTRNTGFEVSKRSIGACWVNSCCEWQNRMEDDICGLDNRRLSVNEKMKQIYQETCLVTQLQNIGLEVAVW